MQLHTYKPTKHITYQYKATKNIPFPQHLTNIAYSHKKCGHIPEGEESPKNTSAEETRLYTTMTTRQTQENFLHMFN
jgi:hypothetical protein